jgi:hypothetical protein
MRDIVIPSSLQEAMSREAQASREKQARIILGEAEVEIANRSRRRPCPIKTTPPHCT